MPNAADRGAGVTFTIRTPRDMVEKLKREAERMDQAPRDSDAAINFFLTAHHIPDWLEKKEMRATEALLKVVSHLANGAKHFELDPNRHKSVETTGLCGEYRTPSRIGRRSVVGPWVGGELFVQVKPGEAAALGIPEQISARELAGMVLAFWDNHLGSG